MASLIDRICSRAVRELGTRVTILNFVPFGHEIVARYQILALGGSYSNTAKMEQSHATQKFPARNVAFCEFAAARFPAPASILEIGAGRAINANLLHTLISPPPAFTLVDAYVDAARYLDSGVKARCFRQSAAEFRPDSVHDLGITRALLSFIPARDAKEALLKMARCCRSLVLSEAIDTARNTRTLVRSDKTLLHPYQAWLEAAGWTVTVHDFLDRDEKFNAIIVASRPD